MAIIVVETAKVVLIIVQGMKQYNMKKKMISAAPYLDREVHMARSAISM